MPGNTVQLLINSLATASLALMAALAFSLIYSIGRYFSFSVGGVIVVGAYLAYSIHTILGYPLVCAAVLATAGGVALGVVLEICVDRPLRSRAASPTMLLLASLGAYVVLVNVVGMVAGEDVRLLIPNQPTLRIGDLAPRLPATRIVILMSGVIVSVLAVAIFRGTRAGKAFRAASIDPQLATLHGIETEPLHLAAVSASAGLASYVGILAAADTDLRPSMGLPILLLGVTTTLVGNRGGVAGLAIAACALGVTQNLAAWTLGLEWRDAITLVLLLLAVILRHQTRFMRRNGLWTGI